jgi:ribosomal subunit interface protein
MQEVSMLKLIISSKNYTVDAKLQKYIDKKIGRLDRFLNKKVRESAHCSLHFSEVKSSDKKTCHIESVLTLPNEQLFCKVESGNMFASLDILEAKLMSLIKKYHDAHNSKPKKSVHRLLLTLKSRF